jgi:hypothetical protein
LAPAREQYKYHNPARLPCEENGEYQHMSVVAATFVRPYQGPHDNHGGVGGADEAVPRSVSADQPAEILP